MWNISLTDDEAKALGAFYNYGATRGNHPEGGGPPPGPLSDHINHMGTVVRKLWEAGWREPWPK